MGALDRYFGAESWDLYTEYMDARYERMIAGKTCLDCGRCRRCERCPDVGFCMEDGEFVYETSVVADLGCESFEPAWGR